jgi:hypothetical protein
MYAPALRADTSGPGVAELLESGGCVGLSRLLDPIYRSEKARGETFTDLTRHSGSYALEIRGKRHRVRSFCSRSGKARQAARLGAMQN